MKKILFILGLFISFAASAQFPNKDSLQRYINRWIRNSPVEAFTNLRLNTALNGLLTEVRSIGVANSGILSMAIVPGDTLQIITTAADTFKVALPAGSMAATNLSVSRTATQVNVQSSTGTTGILPPASQFFGGIMTATDKAKLDSTASLALLRDSVNNRIYHIYRRGDSVFYIKSGAEVFAFLADASVGSGTVTNVATGYGISGGPITSTGTLILDTATISNKYIRHADSLTAYTTRYRLDTANANLRTLIATKLANITGLVTPGTGVSITGSGTSGSPYVISSDAAGGTVTSVGSGYGLTGGPITGAGTLVVDSATLATKFLRRADTSLIFTDYRNAINARVKYTDTTAMLAAYITSLNSKVKYTDTSAMLAAYQTALNLRVKYSDTSSMLSAYATAINSRVKYTDTSAMLAAYITSLNSKVKYTDTSSMLTAYRNALNTKISNVTGYISPGTNVTITGSGTLVDPYVVNSSGGGSGGSGTVNAGAANRLAYYPSAGTTVDDLAAITASRALVSDANGLPVAATTTATEIGYVNGVTSAIQTQINTKQPTISLTTTGTSGAATLVGATLNIPQYAGTTYTAGTRLTLVGSQFNVDSLNLLAPYQTAINARVKYSDTSTILAPYATKINTKQGIIALTTIGSSGAATFDGTTLNIPSYAGGSGGDNGMTGTAIRPLYQGTQNLRTIVASTGMLIDSTTNANSLTYRVDTATIFASLTTAINARITASSTNTLTNKTWNGVPIGTTYGGVPAGGSVGQVLAKINGTDYNTQWIPAPTGTTYGTGYGITGDGENNFLLDTATVSNKYIQRGAIVAGANVTVTGSGTGASPYVIASSGGSGLSDGDKGDITVSSTGSIFTVDNGAITNVKVAAGLDAVKLADGTVTNAEFQFINSLTSNAQTQLDGKQATLVSGTNIKTINGGSVLGSGDLSVSAALTATYIGYGNGSVTGEAALTYNATTNKIATDSIGVLQTSTNNLTATGRLIINPTRADYATITGTAELGPGVYLRSIIPNDGLSVNEHGFVDGTNFSRATKAYAAFDAQSIISGSGNFDHYAGMQQRGEFSGSGTLATYYSFSSAPALTGGGTITNSYHFSNMANSFYTGTVTNEYGLKIKALGGVNKWGVYVDSDRSFFGGNVGIGLNAPGYPLQVNAAGAALGVLDWNNVTQIANADGSKGFNLGYLTTGNYGVIGSQGASSGLTLTTHNGTSWGHRIVIGTNGVIRFPDLAGVGDRGLAVDADGVLKIGSGGGSSQWTDLSPGIYYGNNVGIGAATAPYPLNVNKDGVNIGVLNWYNVAQVANGAGTKGFNFGYDNTASYGIIGAQGTTSGIKFISHNGTSWGNRLIIETDGKISIPEFAGGGDQELGVGNDGKLKIVSGGGGGSGNWVASGSNSYHSSGSATIGSSTINRLLTLDASLPTFGFSRSATEYSLMGIASGTDVGVTGAATNDWFNRTEGGKMLFSTDGGTTASLVLGSSQSITAPVLAGSGTRMVVASSTGVLSTQTIPGGGGGTDFYTTDGTLTSNRSVAGGGFSLSLGTSGSTLSQLNVFTNVTKYDGRIIFKHTNPDGTSNYTISAYEQYLALSTGIAANRTITMPTATNNAGAYPEGAQIVMIMRNSANSFHWSLNAAITDIKTGSTFTQLDWGATYTFMVIGATWYLVNKY